MTSSTDGAKLTISAAEEKLQRPRHGTRKSKGRTRSSSSNTVKALEAVTGRKGKVNASVANLAALFDPAGPAGAPLVTFRRGRVGGGDSDGDSSHRVPRGAAMQFIPVQPSQSQPSRRQSLKPQQLQQSQEPLVKLFPHFEPLQSQSTLPNMQMQTESVSPSPSQSSQQRLSRRKLLLPRLSVRQWHSSRPEPQPSQSPQSPELQQPQPSKSRNWRAMAHVGNEPTGQSPGGLSADGDKDDCRSGSSGGDDAAADAAATLVPLIARMSASRRTRHQFPAKCLRSDASSPISDSSQSAVVSTVAASSPSLVARIDTTVAIPVAKTPLAAQEDDLMDITPMRPPLPAPSAAPFLQQAAVVAGRHLPLVDMWAPLDLTRSMPGQKRDGDGVDNDGGEAGKGKGGDGGRIGRGDSGGGGVADGGAGEWEPMSTANTSPLQPWHIRCLGVRSSSPPSLPPQRQQWEQQKPKHPCGPLEKRSPTRALSSREVVEAVHLGQGISVRSGAAGDRQDMGEDWEGDGKQGTAIEVMVVCETPQPAAAIAMAITPVSPSSWRQRQQPVPMVITPPPPSLQPSLQPLQMVLPQPAGPGQDQNAAVNSQHLERWTDHGDFGQANVDQDRDLEFERDCDLDLDLELDLTQDERAEQVGCWARFAARPLPLAAMRCPQRLVMGATATGLKEGRGISGAAVAPVAVAALGGRAGNSGVGGGRIRCNTTFPVIATIQTNTGGSGGGSGSSGDDGSGGRSGSGDGNGGSGGDICGVNEISTGPSAAAAVPSGGRGQDDVTEDHDNYNDSEDEDAWMHTQLSELAPLPLAAASGYDDMYDDDEGEEFEEGLQQQQQQEVEGELYAGSRSPMAGTQSAAHHRTDSIVRDLPPLPPPLQQEQQQRSPPTDFAAAVLAVAPVELAGSAGGDGDGGSESGGCDTHMEALLEQHGSGREAGNGSSNRDDKGSNGRCSREAVAVSLLYPEFHSVHTTPLAPQLQQQQQWLQPDQHLTAAALPTVASTCDDTHAAAASYAPPPAQRQGCAGPTFSSGGASAAGTAGVPGLQPPQQCPQLQPHPPQQLPPQLQPQLQVPSPPPQKGQQPRQAQHSHPQSQVQIQPLLQPLLQPQGPALGEECSPRFWDGGPDVYEVFPFQRNALEFADWANAVPRATLTALQRAAAATNFASFTERWGFLAAWMARHSPPPPAAADGSAASGAAAHDPAGSVQWNQDTVGARTLNQSYEQIPHPDGGGSNNGEMDGGRAAGRGTAAAAAATAATTAALPVASVVLAAAAAPTSAPRRPLEAIRVFTREYRRKFLGQGGGGGEPTEYSRHFVATTYRVVWRRFQSLQATHRHFYEVIRSDRPCHLYFDIEFSRSANPGVDGDALVDRLLERLLELMRSTWNVQLCPSSHVLELESVTEAQVAGAVAAARAAAAAASAATATAAAEAAPAAMCAPVAAPEAGSCHALPSENVDKFSRHLVVRLPGMALAHNGVAGAIVAKLRPFLQADGLFLLKAGEGPGGATACIVDPAVYSRERHFRMIWCSKGGKAAVLRPTGRYIMGPRETQHQNQQHAAPASAPGRGGPVAVAAAGTCGRRGASGAGEVAVMATAVVAPVPLEASPPTSQQLFLASLICNVHPGARLLDVPQGFLDGLPPLRGGVSTGIASNRSSYRHAGHAYEGNISHPVGGVYRSIKMTWAAEAEDLCDAAALQPPPPLQHQRGQQGQAQGQGQQQQSGGGGGVGGGGRGGGIRGESDCVGCGSHHQTVLQRLALGAVSFVELMATDRAAGAEALVRSIAYCGEGASVTYGMIGPGSHFCDRIGRRHRSNHVFFLLDFLRGCYCQKCYDPECAGWRSEWNAMPPETWQLPGGTPAVALLPQPQPQPQLQPDPGTTTSTSLAAAPHSAAIAPSGSHPCTKNAGNLPEGPSGGVRCSSRATATTTGGGCGDSKPTLVSELFAGLYQWAYGDDVME